MQLLTQIPTLQEKSDSWFSPAAVTTTNKCGQLLCMYQVSWRRFLNPNVLCEINEISPLDFSSSPNSLFALILCSAYKVCSFDVTFFPCLKHHGIYLYYLLLSADCWGSLAQDEGLLLIMNRDNWEPVTRNTTYSLPGTLEANPTVWPSREVGRFLYQILPWPQPSVKQVKVLG